MEKFKFQVTASLSPAEIQLLKEARFKRVDEGKGETSIRDFILLGVYSVIDVDVKTST